MPVIGEGDESGSGEGGEREREHTLIEKWRAAVTEYRTADEQAQALKRNAERLVEDFQDVVAVTPKEGRMMTARCHISDHTGGSYTNLDWDQTITSDEPFHPASSWYSGAVRVDVDREVVTFHSPGLPEHQFAGGDLHGWRRTRYELVVPLAQLDDVDLVLTEDDSVGEQL